MFLDRMPFTLDFIVSGRASGQRVQRVTRGVGLIAAARPAARSRSRARYHISLSSSIAAPLPSPRHAPVVLIRLFHFHGRFDSALSIADSEGG